MGLKKIRVGFGNKKIGIEARELSLIGMLRGLMFRGKECDNLLFDFGKKGRWAIHSWFVFFPFLAIWLDGENRVVGHEIIRPFRFHAAPKKEFSKLIEVPLNNKNAKLASKLLS